MEQVTEVGVNVLLDYSKEVMDSLSSLTKTLKERFGGATFANKHQIELRNRRRPDETLQSLHSDIRRLAALALPAVEHHSRETMANDYFLDALADPDLALKIREKQPMDLDSALRLALQLEVWAADTTRLHATTEHRKTEDRRRIREIKKPKTEATVEVLQKEVEEQRRKFAALENKLLARNNASNAGYRPQEANRPNRDNQPTGAGFGDVEHRHTEFGIVQLLQQTKRHLRPKQEELKRCDHLQEMSDQFVKRKK